MARDFSSRIFICLLYFPMCQLGRAQIAQNFSGVEFIGGTCVNSNQSSSGGTAAVGGCLGGKDNASESASSSADYGSLHAAANLSTLGGNYEALSSGSADSVDAITISGSGSGYIELNLSVDGLITCTKGWACGYGGNSSSASIGAGTVGRSESFDVPSTSSLFGVTAVISTGLVPYTFGTQFESPKT